VINFTIRITTGIWMKGSCKGHVLLMSFIKSNITDRYIIV